MKIIKSILTIFSLLSLTAGYALNDYEKATAGDPQFDNKSLWPNLTGKEKFLDQKYEKGRVMTWAKPGEGVGGRNGLDPWDPENWLVDGEPAEEVYFDENTDIVIPPSERSYRLDLKRVEGWPHLYRHVTVGRNVELLEENVRYFGNIWVKEGGILNARHSNSYYGGDSFVRNDNGTYEDAISGRIGQYFMLRKDKPETTLEIIGYVSLIDRVHIASGTLILSANSRFSPGRNASMIIAEGATVALLDNARLVKWVNQIGQLDFIIFGNMQGGLVDRPLTQPAYVELSYQNTTQVPFYDRLKSESTSRDLERRIASMVVGPKGLLESFSDQPTDLLTIRWSGIRAEDWHIADAQGSGSPYANWVKNLSKDELTYLKSQLDSIPKKLTIIFQSGATIENVAFDDMHKGGFLMENPQDFTRWQGLSYGPGNNAEGEGLITRINRSTVIDSVKNPGGEFQVGVPQPFTQKEAESTTWNSYTFNLQFPQECSGKAIGLRFYTNEENNMVFFDNVELQIQGKNWIKNPGFEDPENITPNSRGIGMELVPEWVNMDNETQNVFVKMIEGRRVGSVYNVGTSMGQTTDYLAKGGEQATLSFEAKTTSGALIAELYCLESH